MKNDKKIIPPSQRKNSFVISYAMGGIGILETILFLIVLILSIILIISIGIIPGILISTVFIILVFYLCNTDSKTNLKGWEKMLRSIEYLQSKKTFTKEEVEKQLFPYIFDDENKKIKSGLNFLNLLKVDGKDIQKMSNQERENFISDFSNIINNIDIQLNFYKNTFNPEKYNEIENINNKIIKFSENKQINLEQKKSSIKQLKSYVVEEIIKKMNKKTNYIFALVAKNNELNESTINFINDLKQINLNANILNYEKSKKFLFNFFNPFNNLEKNKLNNYNNEEENKEEENKFEKIKFNKNNVKIGNNYVRFVSLGKMPLFANDGWFSSLTLFENVIPSFKILDLNQEVCIKNLDIAIQRNELKSNKVSRTSLKQKTELNSINEIYKQIIDEIVEGNERIKDFLPIIMIKGEKLSDINQTQKQINKLLKKDGFSIKELPYIQFSCFETFIPKSQYILRKELSIEMPSLTIGSSFPLITDDFIDEGGTFISNTTQGGEIYWNNELRDDYRFNSNTIILGSSGSGKSILTYKLVLNDFLSGNKVFIIDPEQEYKNLANKIGGKVMDLGGKGINKLNPLKILKNYDNEEGISYINQHISFLKAFFETTNVKIDQEVSIILQKELIQFYSFLKITNEKIKKIYEKIEWPIFDDFLLFIENKSKIKIGKMKELYELLSLILSQYSTGGVYSDLWNGKQNINFDENLIVFDTSSLVNDKYKISGQMLFITKIIWSSIQENKKINENKQNKNYSSIYIDEAHLLMNKNNLFALEWIQMVTKRIRKYSGKLFLITQNVKDFLGDKEISHYTEGIINNISYSFIGKMQPKDLESLNLMYETTGGLSITEKQWIINSGRGKFLLKIGDKLKYFIEKVNINPTEAEIFSKEIFSSFDPNYIKEFNELIENIFN